MWKRWNQTSHLWERSVDNGQTWTILPINISAEAITNNTGLAHGTYLPTASGLVNASGVSFRTSTYMRVGNVVTVAGLIIYTIPSVNGFAIDLNVPIASNMSADGSSGNGVMSGSGYPTITAALYSSGANKMTISGNAIATVSGGFGSFHFTYRIM